MLKGLNKLIAIVLVIFLVFVSSCHNKKELLSDDMTTIIRAAIHYGDDRDTSAVRLLLRKSLDARVSTDIRYKGYSVNYYRVTALHDISGVDPGKSIDRLCDTAATLFYVNWAIKNGFVKDLKDADINYK